MVLNQLFEVLKNHFTPEELNTLTTQKGLIKIQLYNPTTGQVRWQYLHFTAQESNSLAPAEYDG